MLLDLGKAVSLMLSILSLYPVMLSAFFVPGSRWEDRLSLSLLKVALSACICFSKYDLHRGVFLSQKEKD